MKSICIITSTSGFGGTEVYTLSLIKALFKKNYLVELICCGHDIYDRHIQLLNTKNVRIIHTDLKVNVKSKSVKNQWKKLFSEIKSDTLVFIKGSHEMGSLLFLKICRKRFKKVYCIEHGEALPMPEKISKRYFWGLIKGFGLWWYRERFMRRIPVFYVDKIITVNNKMRNRLIREYQYPKNKVYAVPNGVDWKAFERNNQINLEMRKQYNIASDALVFGMITRLSFVKRIDIAIRAFSALLKRQTEKSYYLTIAGSGDKKEELRKLVRDLGIENKVIFLGFLEQPQKALSMYNFIIFSSYSEGLPLGLLEGMAAGCIPIVTEVGGMPDVVNSSDIGWVVKPEDERDLYNAMYSASQLDEQAMYSKRLKAIDRIKENYDSESNFRFTLSILGLESK